jgi:hypothetical protein
MSIHYLRGYLYGCYSIGKVGFERHQREIAGDISDVPEFRSRLLDNVGIAVGEAGSVSGVCAVQLPFDKDGKDQRCATRKT